MNHYTPHGFDGDDDDDDAPIISQCESDTCGQHYGKAQRVHLLSPATGEVMATRCLCLKAQQVANQSYGVTLATETDEGETMQEPLPLAA